MVTQIVTGAHQLLGQIDPDFHQAVISNIVLSGGGSQLKGLDQALEAALREYGRISVTRVCDTAFAGAVGALRLAMGMPPENWEDLRRLNQRATGSALPRAA
jgi:rod shape-determining protein MreB